MIKSTFKKLRWFAVIVGFSLQLIGLNTFGQIDKLFFQHYTTEDGLSQGSIYAIYQDSKKFIWFGTWDGLNRFDGRSFKVFKPNFNQKNWIKGSRVAAIIEDKDENIWVGTYEALNKYNPGKNTFEQVYCVDDSGKIIRDRYYPFFIDHRNELWFTYQNTKLASLNLKTNKVTNHSFVQGQMQHFVSPNGGRKQFYQPLKLIHTVGRDGLRLIDLPGKKIQYFFSSHEKNLAGTKLLFWVSHFDQQGLLWLAGQNGLMSLDTQTHRFVSYKGLQNGHPAEAFTAMAQDKSDRLWCGADGHGLWVFDMKTKAYIAHYKKEAGNKNSLSENVVTSLFFDDEDNLWVNADPQGIDQANLAFQQFKLIQLGSGYNTAMNSVWSMCALDSNRMLICFNQLGIMKYEIQTGQKQIYHLPKNFKESSVYHAIKDSRGTIWMASDVGLYYSKDQLASIHALNDNKFYYYVYLFEDNPRILCGTDKGLFSISNDLHQTVFDTVSQFQHMNISTIAKGPHRQVCVANMKNQLFFIQYENNKYVTKRNFQFEFLIKSIWCQNDQILWMGTNMGLVRYHLQRNETTLFNEQNGLANNYVYGLLPDAHGNLWMSTNKGISEFERNTQKITNHGLSEGLQAWEFNSRSYALADDGTMFFGGVNGMNYFHPDSFRKFPFSPPVRLLSVSMNGKFLPLQAFEINHHPLQMSHDENNITVEFGAIDFNRNRQINYAYKLHDLPDEGWKSVSTQGVLHLVNLAPGKYHLQIRAQMGNNQFSSNILHCHFTISNPFYKTWWFALLLCALLFGFVYSLYKYRVNQIHKMATVKSGISQDLHDDIGSTLSSISLYSEIARRRELRQESVTDLLEKIHLISRELVVQMGDFVWSLNDKHGNLKQLKQRIEDYAAITLTKHEIFFQIEMPEELYAEKLNPKQLKNIFFIFKEALNNSLKYAQCKHFRIVISTQNQMLQIDLSDDGSGFDIDVPKLGMGGSGLKNMKARALSLEGTCEINSQINQGTNIRIVIPMNSNYHYW
jgi:ligand-binding sensor domain-containing protein